MVNSVLNEGARALQITQRDITRAASDIARANVRPDAVNLDTEPDAATSLAPVEQVTEPERQRDIGDSLIELRRQEQIFNAAAEVVSTADQTLGTLLDIQA